MAGRGPAPKPSEQRRRRHARPEEQELPEGGYAGEFPALPESYRTPEGEVEFLVGTRSWYATWGASPMACAFTGTDWERLGMVARLVDQFYRAPKQALLAEIRLQEASWGGSPLDRRRVGLKIAPAQPERDAQLVALDQYRQEVGA